MIRANKLAQLEGPRNVGENGEFGESGDFGEISPRVIAQNAATHPGLKCRVRARFQIQLGCPMVKQ